MTPEQIAAELAQTQVDHAMLLNRAADSLYLRGETGVLIWMGQQQGEIFALDIIDHFGLTPGRVANIVKKLIERGYVSRHLNAMDLRKSRLTLTETGKNYAAKLSKERNSEYLRMLSALGEEDAALLLRLVRKLIALEKE